MKFLYDKSLNIPTIEEKSESCVETCITHCHACKFTIDYTFFSPNCRKVARDFVDSQIRDIRRCQSFFKEYKTQAQLSAAEQAAISAMIELDQQFIDELQAIKPHGCFVS